MTIHDPVTGEVGRMTAEEELGLLAARVVRDAGGSVSWERYDALMRDVVYLAPLAWIDGWGNPILHKENNDKMCAFAACRAGLLAPDDKAQTYTLTEAARAADLGMVDVNRIPLFGESA